ncbi:MAG: hypothetical protein QOE01_1900 [Actinomycetota bacterium]|jgi:hypothetical protein|nr:hypothetical protein [Actinomycetota bacterium]
MASDADTASSRSERERYRLAAEATLEQLDWCVHLLTNLRKHSEARQLRVNVAQVRDRLDR